MLAMRAYLPLDGAAGGMPGATTGLAVRRRDGSREQVSTAAAGVVVEAGEAFEIRCTSGGGVGDPLIAATRTRVAADVARGLLSAAEAAGIYGVVLRQGKVSAAATERKRTTIRRQRLRRASAAGGRRSPAGRAPLDAADVAAALSGNQPPRRRRLCRAFRHSPGPHARVLDQRLPGAAIRAGPRTGHRHPDLSRPLGRDDPVVEATPQAAATATSSSPQHWA